MATKDWNGFKKSGDTYIPNDATARADITSIKDGTNIDSFGDVETALAGKVDKVTGKGLSTNDYTNEDKAVVTTAQDNIIANTQLIADTVGWSGKNKLNHAATSQVLNGITYTVNSDRTINANGTASSNATLTLITADELNSLLAKHGDLFLSGCPTGGGENKYSLFTRRGENNFDRDSGNGVLLKASYTYDRPIYLQIIQGQTVSNSLFKPMIRPADILDSTYEPYFGSTAFPRSEQAIVGAENFFVPFASDSKSGMTFTVDSDGVVDVDGQPSANHVNIKSVFTLKNGTYTVSGVPSGFGTNKMLIALYDMNNVQIAVDNGSGATFTLNADTQLQGYIYVYQPYGDFDHVKVYPMINLGTVARPFAPYAMTNKQLTENVTPIKNNSAITFAEGVTPAAGDQIAIYKIGDLKILSMFITGATISANTWFTLGTLSDEFKPRAIYDGFANVNGKTDACDVMVQIDKILRFRNNSGAVASTDIIKLMAIYV